jgi:hypothetical protein
MWRIHEVSSSSSVGVSAGLRRSTFRQWVRMLGQAHPWLADWLYTTRTVPPPEANGFKPTTKMEAFRNETSYSSLISAALEQDPKLSLSDSLISAWRQQYKSYPWFDRWLLRGEDAPPNVTVATVDQADRCERAWDFNEFCRRLVAKAAKKSAKKATEKAAATALYAQWIRRGQIATVGWLRWLYGWPEPAGTFVVSAGLQRLRTAMSRKGIAAAADLYENAIRGWNQDSRTRAMVPGIMAGGDPTHVPGWEKLRGNTKPEESKSGWGSLGGNTQACVLIRYPLRRAAHVIRGPCGRPLPITVGPIGSITIGHVRAR